MGPKAAAFLTSSQGRRGSLVHRSSPSFDHPQQVKHTRARILLRGASLPSAQLQDTRKGGCRDSDTGVAASWGKKRFGQEERVRKCRLDGGVASSRPTEGLGRR